MGPVQIVSQRAATRQHAAAQHKLVLPSVKSSLRLPRVLPAVPTAAAPGGDLHPHFTDRVLLLQPLHA